MLTDQDSRDPLNWLSGILWPDRSTTVEPGGPAGPQWWASPSVDKPQILIPARSIAAARTAVRRYHDGFSPKQRLRSLAAEGLLAFEPVARLVLRRKRVGTTHRPSAVAAAGIGPSVLEGIAELIGVPDLEVAVSLSTPKSNQKPVLQLLDGDGHCRGWAKVAWNQRTDALVGNEASWLRRPAELPLSKPELLHDVEIAGRRVAISSGVDASRRPRGRTGKPPAVDVFRAVAALGTVESVAIEHSPWWRSVEEILDWATERERAAIVGAIGSCHGLRFRLGAWHGDLTPWNLMTTADRVHLIDWEFAADGVPFGFDLCHFHTQVAMEMTGRSAGQADPGRVAAAAIDHSARLSPHGLADLGVEPQNRLPVWRLYLVELVRRSISLRASDYPMDGVVQGSAALDRLERALGPASWTTAGLEPAIEPNPDPNPASATDPDPDRGEDPQIDELPAVGGGHGYTIRDRQTGATAR